MSGIGQSNQVFLTLSKPSDFYVTNVEFELQPVRKIRKVRFAKVYEKFAWFLFATETSGNLLIYRIVYNGNRPVFVPFDEYALVFPSSGFSTFPFPSDTSVVPQWKRRPFDNSHEGKPVYRNTHHNKKSMQIYVDSQDLTLNPDKMCVCRISKSREQRQYIAVKKQNYIGQQSPAHSGSKEIEIQNGIDANIDYKSDTTLVEPAGCVALTDHYEDEKKCKSVKRVPHRSSRQVKLLHLYMNKHHSSRRKFQTKRKVKRLFHAPKNAKRRRGRSSTKTYTSVSRYYIAKPQRKKRSGKVKRIIWCKPVTRDCVRIRNALYLRGKTKVAQETQSSSSKLDFARLYSVVNVLKKHSPRNGERLYRSSNGASVSRTREESLVPSYAQNRHAAFLGMRHREHRSGNAGGVQSTADNFRAIEHSPRTLERDGSLLSNPQQHVNVVQLPFDIEEITQLLHASAYSKIILQLEPIPRNIPPEPFIPLHFILGVVHFKAQNYKEAKEFFNLCEGVAMHAHRDGDVMLCSAYLGDMEYASKLYLNATSYYQKAIKHYTSGSVALMFKLTPPTVSAIHAKLASSYRNINMMVQAIHHYKTAISTAKTDRDQLSARTSLGNLYQSMGDNSNALNEYKKSIQLAEKLSDHISLGWAHGNIGNAYLGLNRKDEAVYHLHKSLDLAVEYEQTPQAIGRTYNNLGTAYQSMNDLDKAEEYYDLALSQAIYGNDIAGQARVYGNIGNVHMLRKNYEQAIPHYSEVLRLSKDPSTVNTARHNRGCAYYEWATSLEQKNSHECTYHGPHCDIDTCQSSLSYKARELYQKGCEDLKEVVKYHEERLQHVKGSPSGLTLSVSLFESNSRTFHRLQDCLARLHRYEEALVVAEQCRARTLGELLLTRKKGHLTEPLTPPLSFDQVVSIVNRIEWPLIYFSYTGARLICWMFPVIQGQKVLKMFEVPLTDEQFDGKSFDYHLRYSLTEKLVERRFEMYESIEYDSESSEEVQTLFEIVGKPIVTVLQNKVSDAFTAEQTTTVSDSYTSLLPLTCLLDPESGCFLGDHYYFNIAPSLLTMGIMNEFTSKVDVQGDICIVIGDPSIPPFYLNNEPWILGRLPYARREAEWVSHALKTKPILGDQATKGAFLIRLMNAKIVHIATHGSASAGFLAFGAFSKSYKDNYVDSSSVLLYPEDIEKLHISPALVVLSSCDSSRGTVKADGIQGMARAFILAGAQSVLTTLWKVPDESASVFMQFFYQYLMDGLRSSLALQKAILSVRCFSKYSQYIHWSGYQLTGSDTYIQLSFKSAASTAALEHHLGTPSIFPRIAEIKTLEKALVNNPSLPTDIQVLRGPPGVDPSEVVIDFITSFHKHFSGGIYWINCLCPEMIQYSIEYIEEICGSSILNLPLSEIKQALFVLDSMTELPAIESLLRILKSYHVHIIAVSTGYSSLDKLIKEIDHKLVRGCSCHDIHPLRRIHSTQRLVHTVMKNVNFAPTTTDQRLFEQLAEFTTGSPPIVTVASQILLANYSQNHSKAAQHITEALQLKTSSCDKPHPTYSSPDTVVKQPSTEYGWETNTMYDSWDSIIALIEACKLSPVERLLLNCVSIFRGQPIPLPLVTEISSKIAKISQKVHLTGSLYNKLVAHKLVKPYPLPTVTYSPKSAKEKDYETEFVYIPRYLAECIWKNMEKIDKIVVLTVIHSSISVLRELRKTSSKSACVIHSLFLNVFDQNYALVGRECYQSFVCAVMNR